MNRSAAAYEVLHPKLVKSYALDALLQEKRSRRKASLEDARAFVAETQSCSEKRCKSTGLGWDYRFEGGSIVGSSLVHNEPASIRRSSGHSKRRKLVEGKLLETG
jgi:hypothetical protein